MNNQFINKFVMRYEKETRDAIDHYRTELTKIASTERVEEAQMTIANLSMNAEIIDEPQMENSDEDFVSIEAHTEDMKDKQNERNENERKKTPDGYEEHKNIGERKILSEKPIFSDDSGDRKKLEMGVSNLQDSKNNVIENSSANKKTEETCIIDHELMEDESRLNEPTLLMEKDPGQSIIANMTIRKARRRYGKRLLKRKYNEDPEDQELFKRRKTKSEKCYLVEHNMILKKEMEAAGKSAMSSEDRKKIEILDSKIEKILESIEEREKKYRSGVEEMIEKKMKTAEKESMETDILLKKILEKSSIVDTKIKEMTEWKEKIENMMMLFNKEKKEIGEMREELESERRELREELGKGKKNMEDTLEKLEMKERRLHHIIENEISEERIEKIARNTAEEEMKRQIEKIMEDSVKNIVMDIMNQIKLKEKQKLSILDNGREKIKNMVVGSIVQRLGKTNSGKIDEDLEKEKIRLKKKKDKSTRTIEERESELNVDQIKPYFLYKQSIDSQGSGEKGSFEKTSGDPRYYVPNTKIPVFESEDEFEKKGKHYCTKKFVPDKEIDGIVAKQNHVEIRKYFGNQTEIDVENIFPHIKNVSNNSPNKLLKRRNP